MPRQCIYKTRLQDNCFVNGPLSVDFWYSYWWIGNKSNKELNCVMMLIIIPRSTLQFQFFLGFNKCLWNILFSINNFLFHAQNISSLVVQRYRLSKYFNFVSVSIPYKTNTFYQILKVSHTLVCSVHYLDFLSVFFMKDCNFFI